MAESGRGWATTPVTELGCVRVSSTPAFVPGARSPREALTLLRRLCEHEGHAFWHDDVKLRATLGDLSRLATHRQVTDAHLLAVATARAGRLVTFDRGLLELAGDAERARVDLIGV